MPATVEVHEIRWASAGWARAFVAARIECTLHRIDQIWTETKLAIERVEPKLSRREATGQVVKTVAEILDTQAKIHGQPVGWAPLVGGGITAEIRRHRVDLGSRTWLCHDPPGVISYSWGTRGRRDGGRQTLRLPIDDTGDRAVLCRVRRQRGCTV